jgi:WD40 repeat protein
LYCKSVDIDEWIAWRGQGRDLCTQGICLNLERSFQPETVLWIELESKPHCVRTLLVRVRWSAKSEAGGWLVGCALTQPLHEEEVEALINQSIQAEAEARESAAAASAKSKDSSPAHLVLASSQTGVADTVERLRDRVSRKTMAIRLPSRRTLQVGLPTPIPPAPPPEASRPVPARPPSPPPRKEPAPPSSPAAPRSTPKQADQPTESAADTKTERAGGDAVAKELLARLSGQLESDDLVEARKTLLALLERNPGDSESLDLLAYVHDHLDSPNRVGEIRCFSGHRSPVNCVAFAPDGQRVFSGSGGEYVDGFYTDGEDRTLSIWNSMTGNEIARFKEQNSPVLCVACAPDGGHIVTASRSGNLYYIDTRDVSIFRTIANHRQMIFGLGFAKDGRLLLTGSDDGVVRLWDLLGKRLRRFEGHTSAVTSVAFSPDGRWALSGSLDSTVRLWDVANGAALRCFEGHAKGVLSVAFAPDGRHVLSGSADATVRLWDIEKGSSIHCFEGHGGGVAAVAFTADGQRIVSGSADKSVRCWEVAGGTELHCFTGHTAAVKCLAISPAGRRLLSGSVDRTVRLWRMPP